MSGFHDVSFPIDIAAGAVGGPRFDVDVVRRRGGVESRAVRARSGYIEYEVGCGVRNAEQRDALIAFFRARKGRAYGFRFRDKSDCRADGQMIGEGDGETLAFPLIKTYEGAEEGDARIIAKPVADDFAIYVNDAPLLSGYSMNVATGVVTFALPPADGAVISADFTFDVPVRFDVDALAMRSDVGERYFWNDVRLIEIKE
ncbi:MAG: DUF2460 domain-containing protein [Rickettsiales bacterium]